MEIDEEDLSELGLSSFDELEGLDLIAKLDKSMYGTKQGPRCWNKRYTLCFPENSTSRGLMLTRVYT